MTDFQWMAIAVVSVISTARITRLMTWDVFPPVVWLRIHWDRLTRDGSWTPLLHCGYCFAVWAAAFVVGWGYVSDWNVVWWLFNGGLSVAYLGAILMAFDGDDEE